MKAQGCAAVFAAGYSDLKYSLYRDPSLSCKRSVKCGSTFMEVALAVPGRAGLLPSRSVSQQGFNAGLLYVSVHGLFVNLGLIKNQLCTAGCIWCLGTG